MSGPDLNYFAQGSDEAVPLGMVTREDLALALKFNLLFSEGIALAAGTILSNELFKAAVLDKRDCERLEGLRACFSSRASSPPPLIRPVFRRSGDTFAEVADGLLRNSTRLNIRESDLPDFADALDRTRFTPILINEARLIRDRYETVVELVSSVEADGLCNPDGTQAIPPGHSTSLLGWLKNGADRDDFQISRLFEYLRTERMSNELRRAFEVAAETASNVCLAEASGAKLSVPLAMLPTTRKIYKTRKVAGHTRVLSRDKRQVRGQERQIHFDRGWIEGLRIADIVRLRVSPVFEQARATFDGMRSGRMSIEWDQVCDRLAACAAFLQEHHGGDRGSRETERKSARRQRTHATVKGTVVGTSVIQIWLLVTGGEYLAAVLGATALGLEAWCERHERCATVQAPDVSGEPLAYDPLEGRIRSP